MVFGFTKLNFFKKNLEMMDLGAKLSALSHAVRFCSLNSWNLRWLDISKCFQTYSFDSPNSVLNEAVLNLAVGVLVAISGGVLLLV